MDAHLRALARRRRRQARRRYLQRVRAELLFFAEACRALVAPAVQLAVLAVVGAVLLRLFGGPKQGEPLPWDTAAWWAWSLLVGEQPREPPPHPVGQSLLYALPVLGIVLLAEGLVKLAATAFNKQGNQARWVRIMANASRNHVVLCGLGTVGFRVLEELVRLGEQVFCIERNPACEFLERARELGANVVVGDARADNQMAQLNLRAARAVIVATDDDLTNLEIAMDVREHHRDVPIVLRCFDQRLARNVQHVLGTQLSVSTSSLAAPLLASAALDRCVVGTHRIGDSTLVMLDLEVKAGGELAHQKVADVLSRHGLHVMAVRLGSESWTLQPEGGRILPPGCRVQIMVPAGQSERVHALNGGRGERE